MFLNPAPWSDANANLCIGIPVVVLTQIDDWSCESIECEKAVSQTPQVVGGGGGGGGGGRPTWPAWL